jgi:hypothetical protein
MDMLEHWKVFLESVDYSISKAYVWKGNSKSSDFRESSLPKLLKQVRYLYDFYCFLVSMLLKQNYDIGVKTRIFPESFSSHLKKLQELCLESPAVCLLAIQKVKISNCSNISGVDALAFTSLAKKKQEFFKRRIAGTLYSKSLKNIKIKKDVPKAAVLKSMQKRFWQIMWLRKTTSYFGCCLKNVWSGV